MPAVYEVIGPLPKQDNPSARRSPFWEDGFSTASQYTRCRSAENRDIHCFELRGEDDATVGFLGLSLYPEGDATQMVAFASVEYIFVKPDFRGQRLGMLLLERALYLVSLWLEMLRDETASLEFQSISSFQSRHGWKAVAVWDLALHAHCRRHGIPFFSSALGELAEDLG